MRILYDSFKSAYKTPFGTLTAGQRCTLHIDIPTSCLSQEVAVVVECDRTGEQQCFPLTLEAQSGGYDRFGGTFTLTQPDLYFYWFTIRTQNESFRLFRYDLHDTNIEDGDKWQLSCVPADEAPDWAKGAVMYQIFPDRFCREGACDLTGKLEPYTVHESEDEPPHWQPDAHGKVLNNDFYGGNLAGITAKLDYLRTLGVTVLYLNPIFKAFSSHRYDTCDYMTIDPMLGTEDDFIRLCKHAHKRNMRIILDGVFSHTGSRSVYFDKDDCFGSGAYHHPESPYREWYQFRHYPHDYVSWWDFETLPCIDKMNESYGAFIETVVEKWLTLGADGFRLDVADELPDAFIARIRRKIRACNKDALLIGEVWEDASNKIAYAVRRRYFTDGELDGVMNYPWRKAILAFLRGEDDGRNLGRALETLYENYPAGVLNCTMLPLSTHDSARVLTELVAPFEGTREQMAAHRLTAEQREQGLRRLRLAAALQYALPGMPSIYYGDEAGVEGCKDPFNRTFFPWRHADEALTAFYRRLGAWRNGEEALKRGSLAVVRADGGVVTVRRTLGSESVEVTIDAANETWYVNGVPMEL